MTVTTTATDTTATEPATGRRRRPAADPAVAAAPPVAAPPTGRRRKPTDSAQTAPFATGLCATGLGRAPRPEATPKAMSAPSVAKPPTVARKPAPTLASVVELPAGHRAAPAVPERHRAARHLHAPSGTSLVAGAAAVAVAAIGAIGAAQSGAELGVSGVSGVEMSRASALSPGLTGGPASITVDTSERDAVRASRERARAALADRKRDAAEVRKRSVAAARAVAEARESAERLARLAKLFRMPVSGYRLTAHFGESSGYWSAGHTGLDFAAPYGTPIRAVANGVVVFSGWDGSYGYKTVIRHADGTETWYAHQSRMLIRSGQVAAGDIIGRVGSTGNSTGSHLHFEVRVNDIALNPLVWLRARGLNP
ncbi:MAG: M23 family metallopeptidase [Sporichthyaceae bacterium]